MTPTVLLALASLALSVLPWLRRRRRGLPSGAAAAAIVAGIESATGQRPAWAQVEAGGGRLALVLPAAEPERAGLLLAELGLVADLVLVDVDNGRLVIHPREEPSDAPTDWLLAIEGQVLPLDVGAA